VNIKLQNTIGDCFVASSSQWR